MAIKQVCEIDGIPFDGERNWQDTEITINFDDDGEPHFNIDSISIVGDIIDHILNHLNNGANGGGGYFQALDYTRKIGANFQFNGILDFTDEATVIGEEEIIVKVKQKQGVDWLSENAGGISFGSLAGQGKISQSDYVKMSYIINYIPDFMQLIMLAISIFILVKELIQVIRDIADAIRELINSVTPSIGFGIVFDLGDVIWVIIGLIMRIIYAIAIVIALVKMTILIMEQLIPKRREHLGMNIIRMFQVLVEEMGYTFHSDLLFNTDAKDLAIIPQKFEKGGEAGEVGYPDAGSPIYFGDKFIASMMNLFNAKPTIIGNEFHFERIDIDVTAVSFIIKPFYNDQDRQLVRTGKNTSEIKANYLISHLYDTQDQNTLDNVEGLNYQQSVKNVANVDPERNLLKGLTEIGTGYALGTYKKGLTGLEKVLKGFAKFADSTTGVLGKGTNFVAKIQAREGSCLLSSHFISVNKLVSMNGKKLKSQQRSFTGAKWFWDNCHFINSPLPINGVHNQWELIPETPIEMCEEKLLSLLSNNNATTEQGEKARISKITWKPREEKAIIDYRINKLYASFTAEYYG